MQYKKSAVNETKADFSNKQLMLLILFLVQIILLEVFYCFKKQQEKTPILIGVYS